MQHQILYFVNFITFDDRHLVTFRTEMIAAEKTAKKLYKDLT
jgi:hypothetical protein